MNLSTFSNGAGDIERNQIVLDGLEGAEETDPLFSLDVIDESNDLNGILNNSFLTNVVTAELFKESLVFSVVDGSLDLFSEDVESSRGGVDGFRNVSTSEEVSVLPELEGVSEFVDLRGKLDSFLDEGQDVGLDFSDYFSLDGGSEQIEEFVVKEVAGEVQDDFRGVVGSFEGLFEVGTRVPVNRSPSRKDFMVNSLVVEEVS